MQRKFIEIGAGADGQWGIDLLNDGWKGYFVEPHPANLIALQKNLENYIDYTLLNFGIWHSNEIKTINSEFKDLDETGIKFHLADSAPFYSKGDRIRQTAFSFEIACITLKDLLGFTGWVDRIRMDVEGAEIPILMNHKWVDMPEELHVEFHSNDYIPDINRKLEDMGMGNIGNERLEYVYAKRD